MKTVALTATKRHGGLDVTVESLLRQTRQINLWIVADELYEERRFEFDDQTSDLPWDTIHMQPRVKPKGYYSDLPRIYNDMIRIALEEECDIAVSLQDYVSAPAFGVEKFSECIKETGGLVAGLCSMSQYPDALSVADSEGLWTIFEEPWKRGDEIFLDALGWSDVRGAVYRSDGPQIAEPEHWEMNWSAFPLDICRHGILFDERYGEHIGNENQQFAWAAHLKLDRQIYVDPTNHALSLPHRHYFPQEWAEQQHHRGENTILHEEIYGGVKKLRQGRLS